MPRNKLKKKETIDSQLNELYKALLSRKNGNAEKSYTARLLSEGSARIAQKLGEEALETAIAAALRQKENVIAESADLLYHLLVLWIDQGVQPEEIMACLRSRQGQSGLIEKKNRNRKVKK